MFDCSNKCGTSTFCDTIYIDSAHWGGAFRLSENKTYFGQEGKPTNYAPDAIFYPNPMQNFGILSYRFKEEGETGNFYLRDSQGKLIVEKELKQQKDKLVIPTDFWHHLVYISTLSGQTRVMCLKVNYANNDPEI